MSPDLSTDRAAVLSDALAHWWLGVANHALSSVGRVEFGVPAAGPGAHKGAKVARLDEACFDAGPSLHVAGDRITVYLRARDPKGVWAQGLLSKHGGHEIENYNLFSVQMGVGVVIGFEVHTDRGFKMICFPLSRIKSTAWHDFVGRYDGKTLSLNCDGKTMAEQPWSGSLTQNDQPVFLGADAADHKPVRLFSGEMEEAAIWKRALGDREVAILMGKKVLERDSEATYRSPVHYRPNSDRLADTIPFYWKGDYHVFYLRSTDKVPWEHIVSKDLVHWKELPTALVSDGAADGPDGRHMFTGSVAERNGVFHIFYTGHNPANPRGLEFVMHATSPDLVHWTKHPEDMLEPDGIHYKNAPQRDFRNPYVFWNDAENRYWMVFIANDARTGAAVQGLAVSDDLHSWKQVEPLKDAPGQECPDLFRIGDTWYLIGGDMVRYAKDPRGPYKESISPVIDRPFIYAGKRMFDGKRNVWTGWLWDRVPESDAGEPQWGGTQCLPRELYAGPDGQLFCRPVPEVVAVFDRTVLDLRSATKKMEFSESSWSVTDGGALKGRASVRSQCSFAVPSDYMVEATLKLDSAATLCMAVREGPKGGYKLVLRPGKQEFEIAGPAFSHSRRIILDPRKPIRIRAFVLGTMIECFVNDQFAFSCRAYDFRTGRLGFSVAGGKAEVHELWVKVPGRAGKSGGLR